MPLSCGCMASTERKLHFGLLMVGFLVLGLIATVYIDSETMNPPHGVVHFGKACQSVADKYLGGLGKDKQLTRTQYVEMMANLTACQSRHEAAE